MVTRSSIKPVPIAYSDLKSEFLCQSSYIAQNLLDSPEPPCMPGISPAPSSPHITRTSTAQVLLPSTLNRSFVHNEQSDLVVAFLLKSSRTFSPNVTHTYHSSPRHLRLRGNVAAHRLHQSKRAQKVLKQRCLRV